jgi:putative peptide zinc metalloprotease protein
VSAAPSLPALRQELLLHDGPQHRDGSPSWTLEDPARGQFFRLGWVEVEILGRWGLGQPEAIAQAISQSTTLEVEKDDVEQFKGFLHNNQLLQCQGQEDNARLARIAAGQKTSWGRWLLKNYLFVRIPLLRPDRFLERSLPWVEPFYSRRFLQLTLGAGLLGLFLVARQWDSFLHTFLHFFTLEGAALAGLTLFLTKVLHELGHAYTCKRFGGRVATMGVALLVMWPVLYTDTSGAWRLRRQQQRLAIGAAGMLTELALAAWATLLWSFLPDGMLRSAAFMLATTTWILTLAINLSPFMRFDGYFLLSDLLEVPNLQQRAFRLTRWRVREWLFAFDEPRPERFEPWLERTLVAYSIGTWIYRFFLFLGIALLVYHFAFKLLGIALFVVESLYFLLMPIVNELREWYARRKDYRMNRHSLSTLLVIAGLLLLACIPWSGSVHAPALLRAEQQAVLYVPVAARLERIEVTPGQSVKAGQALFRLDAPDLRQELQSLDRRILTLQWQNSFQVLNRETAANLLVVRQELAAAQERQRLLRQQMQQLTVYAAFDGVLADLAEPLEPGEWLAAGEWLGTLVGTQGARVEAFVEEQDLARLEPGSRARFYPESLSRAPVDLHLESLGQTAVRRLTSTPELASVYQGAIAATLDHDRVPQPEKALYRALLRPAPNTPSPTLSLRGTVLLEGQAQSLAMRVWRSVLAILIRESAF